MFVELGYDNRKVARRKFRRKVDTFLRKGEELATSSNDLQVLIVVYSKELNQIVDYCNCNASELVGRYFASKQSTLEDSLADNQSALSLDSTSLVLQEQYKRKAASDEKLQGKKPKLSASQLSSTRADTEREGRSRSPTIRPYSPSSSRSNCDFGRPRFELQNFTPGLPPTSSLQKTEFQCYSRSPSGGGMPASLFDEDEVYRDQPIADAAAEFLFPSSYKDAPIQDRELDLVLCTPPKYESPRSGEDMWACKDDEDLFDIL